MAQLSVKVFHVENKVTKEIRKFSVDAEVAENYEYLVGKIRQVFPDLSSKDFELFWKDEEEDFINLSSDEELSQAVQAVPVSVGCMKIYVQVKKQFEGSSEIEHPGVNCDGCDTLPIKGVRYQCTVCCDYDLCSDCESKGIHPADHELLCIKSPCKRSSDFMMRGAFGGYRGGFGSPRGGFGCPREGFGNPRGGFSSPRGGFGCPRGGFGNPRGGFSSPRSGFGCPRGGFSSPRNGFGCPRGGFSSPRSGFGNPRGGFDSRRGGFGSPGGGFSGFPGWPRGGFCGPYEDARCNAESQETEEESGMSGYGLSFHEMIKQFAVSLGMDPDVAISQAGEFADNGSFKKVIEHLAHCFGMDPEILRQYGEQLFGACQYDNERQEQKDQDFAAESAKKTVPKDDQNNMKTDQASPSSEKDDKTEATATLKNVQLTKEEKYEQKLNDSIKQMEAMGFDNDGNWLRQLLIAKDLSLERVLDTLSPSK